MVENVEQFSATFHVRSLRDRDVLQDRKISLADVRAAADRPRSIANAAKQTGINRRVFPKNVGIEEVIAMALRMLRMKRRELIGFAGQFEIEAVHELVVCLGRNADREAGLESRDARDRPAIQGDGLESTVLRHGQFPVVTGDDAMSGVEQ